MVATGLAALAAWPLAVWGGVSARRGNGPVRLSTILYLFNIS